MDEEEFDKVLAKMREIATILETRTHRGFDRTSSDVFNKGAQQMMDYEARQSCVLLKSGDASPRVRVRERTP